MIAGNIQKFLAVSAALVAIHLPSMAQTNLAYDQASPTVNPAMTEQARKMEQRVYKVSDNVYSAVGFALANSTMIIGSDGIVIVDVTESVEAGEKVLQAFRKITDKPVRAIIYTHNHPDHTLGAKAFASEQDVLAGKVHIYAHESMMKAVIGNATVVAPILGLRSAYSFGAMLERGPEGWIHQGIGPALVRGETGFIKPTDTFSDTLEINTSGLRIQLRHAPSETDDEIVVWLPDQKLLQSAEVIQGETFPNVHTLRGTRYRDPVNWYKSIDLLRNYHPEFLVPSHGRPLSGKEKIEEMLTAYRDAIQYVHDQTVRLMNKGLTPDEIAEQLAHLPEHLRNHPWLGEYYGTVKHSVRQIYNGYLGWFDGDPTDLDPTPRKEEARRYIELMGGRSNVLSAANKAADSGDFQWAAELLTHLIRVDNADLEARKMKALALRQLGYRTANSNWRNWYLTSAKELESTMNTKLAAFAMSSFAAPDILKSLPVNKFFEAMAVRLDPAKCADLLMTVGFRFTDTGTVVAVEVRRGVAELHDVLPAKPDATVNLTTRDLYRVMSRQTNLAGLVREGAVKVEGNLGALLKFYGLFDPIPSEPPALTVR